MKPVRRRAAALVPVLAVLVGVALVPPSSAGGTPRAGSTGHAHPGDVVRARPATFYTGPLVRTNARAWTVLYRSTTATGKPVAVSGTVLVPRKSWPGPGLRPIVSYSPGTTGMADRCAVSRSVTVPATDPVTSYEAPFITALLAKGWAVAVTDYQGLGTPGDHTYVVGRALGRNALDVVRAAQRLPKAGLSASAPVLIWGYSEGGNGAGWAAQLAPAYAPELKIKAAAIGGVPNDLLAMFHGHDGGPLATLVAMAAIGLDAAYPELRLDSYLKPRGRAALRLVRNSCLDAGLAMGLFERTSGFTTSDPLRSPVWRERLAQNTLGNYPPPPFPVFLYQGTYDEAVFYRQARALRDAWCAAGAGLTWKTTPAEHLTAYGALAPSAALFLVQRLAGGPARSNCP